MSQNTTVRPVSYSSDCTSISLFRLRIAFVEISISWKIPLGKVQTVKIRNHPRTIANLLSTEHINVYVYIKLKYTFAKEKKEIKKLFSKSNCRQCQTLNLQQDYIRSEIRNP